jgi:hypothetical protein
MIKKVIILDKLCHIINTFIIMVQRDNNKVIQYTGSQFWPFTTNYDANDSF